MFGQALVLMSHVTLYRPLTVSSAVLQQCTSIASDDKLHAHHNQRNQGCR